MVSRLLWASVPPALAVLLGIVAAGSSPTPALAAIVLTVAAVLIFVLRIDLASLVVITIPLMFYMELGVRVNVSASDIFIILLAARALTDRKLTAARHRLRVPVAVAALSVLVLFASMTFAIFVPREIPVAWQAFFVDAPKLLVVFVYFLVAVMVFYQKFQVNDLRFLSAWVYTAVVVSALGTAGSLLYDRGIDLGFTYSFRATATFEDPNAYAAYLLSSLGVVMAWAYFKKQRILSWALVPLLIGIYFSYSRAAMIAIVIVFAAGFVLSFGAYSLRGIRRLAYVVAVIVAIAFISGRLDSLIESRRDLNVEGDIRLSVWAAAVRVWSESPIVGVGLGQFRAATAAYVEASVTPLAHNTYLSFLAEGGIVGLVMFLSIPLAVGILLFRDRGVISRLFLLSVAGFATMGASLNLQNSRSIWLLLGIFMAWSLVRSDGFDERTGSETTHAADLSSGAVRSFGRRAAAGIKLGREI